MSLVKHMALLIILLVMIPAISIASHLVIKNDFDGDGKADRTTFASFGISGFFQKDPNLKKVSSFYIKQGNRTILYINSRDLGSPHIKLTENNGLMQVVTIMKFDQKSFKHVKSFAIPNKTYFSNDPFATSDPFAQQINSNICETNDSFSNKTIKNTLSWADELKTHSLQESLKKSIDPSCKSVFGDQYPVLEEQILAACGVNTGKTEENNLVTCLDKNEETRITSGIYTSALAENFFTEGFQITCESIDKNKPLASLTSNKISIFQTTPALKNRNFKADFFHEMMHFGGIEKDQPIENLVSKCIEDKGVGTGKGHFTNTVTANERIFGAKDGVEVSIPAQLKEVQQTTIAAAVNEGTKTLDSNFSMENSAQFESLSKASKATFKSFDPIMKAAYEAAIPTAFAQGSLASSTSTNGASTTVAMPTVKSATTSTRTIASTTTTNSAVTAGSSYDVSSLPASVAASTNGELGNGLAVKASAVNIKEGLARSPSSTETSSGGSARTALGGGSLGYIPTTDRPDLRNNVPQLKAEEDFIKTLTTGKYSEVKARLTDPNNQKILEDKRIQYVARDKTLGSKQPVMILKDLGNKFSIVRVTIE